MIEKLIFNKNYDKIYYKLKKDIKNEFYYKNS